jgi:hypothetical protein
MSNKSRLISGRVPVSNSANVTSDRYQYLDLSSAEPNLGTGNTGDVLTYNSSYPGGRRWIPQSDIAGSVGQAAFDKANTASANTIYLTGVNTTQNTSISAVDTYATGAFNKANSANVLAQAAFDAANTASAGSIDQTARNIANTASANTIVIQGVDTTQNTNIAAANTKAQAAFDKANTAPKTTTSTTAPASPNVGDMWYDTDNDVLLRYINDGTSNNWIDVTGPTIGKSTYIRQTYLITANVS